MQLMAGIRITFHFSNMTGVVFIGVSIEFYFKKLMNLKIINELI